MRATPHTTSARRSALLLAFLLGACRAEQPRRGIEVRETSLGDTIVDTSVGVPDTIGVDSARTVWQSDALDNPNSMVVSGNRLVIGDRTQVHILTLSHSTVADDVTVGRQGSGPGEYQRIYGVTILGSDTVAVFDASSQRLSRLSMDGTFLGSTPVRPREPYVNPVFGGEIHAWRDGLLMRARSLIVPNQPMGEALLWVDLSADSVSAVREWEGLTLVQLSDRFFGPKKLFPSNPMTTIGPGPVLAMGDGLEYCFTLTELGGDTPPRRLCRDRPRTPVGEGMHDPDLSALEAGSPARLNMQAIVAHEEFPDVLPSYDELLYAPPGEVWVRTMGPEVADVLPSVRVLDPSQRPSRRFWDVFDTHEGRLLHTLAIPSSFQPKAFTPDRVYGFLTLETGEIVVAAFRR